jgi:hypothetical protein
MTDDAPWNLSPRRFNAALDNYDATLGQWRNQQQTAGFERWARDSDHRVGCWLQDVVKSSHAFLLHPAAAGIT